MKQIHNMLTCRFATGVLMLLLPILAYPQSIQLTVGAFDGKSGKPLPAQRLLIFLGATQEEVDFHKRSKDVVTSKDGLATLEIDGSQDKWIQVLVDFHTLCQVKPRAPNFSVEQIVAKGFSTPNSCGSFTKEASPNRLNVYARSPTLPEKMDW